MLYEHSHIKIFQQEVSQTHLLTILTNFDNISLYGHKL